MCVCVCVYLKPSAAGILVYAPPSSGIVRVGVWGCVQCKLVPENHKNPEKLQIRGGGIPHRRERYHVCPQRCRNTRTVTRVRHHLLF